MKRRTLAAAAGLAAMSYLAPAGCGPAAPPGAATRPAVTAPAGPRPYVERVPGTEIAFAMTPIPAGRFRMGSPATEKGRKPDEGPQVEVEMEAFHIATHEVTWRDFAAFARRYGDDKVVRYERDKVPADRWADAVSQPTPLYDYMIHPELDRLGRGDGKPVVVVSRFTAKQYAKWVSLKTGRFYRLPTEAEWEYACRAGSTTPFADGGDDAAALSEHGWYATNSTLPDGDPGYRKVGTKRPNAWGVYDLHGNVGEWVVDAYDADWYAKLAAKGRPVRWDEAINWPTSRYPGVIRGGGFWSEAVDCRSASRFVATERRLNYYDDTRPRNVNWEYNADWVGFRLVSPAREPTEDVKRQYWEPERDAESVRGMARDSMRWELVEPATRPTTR